MVVFQTVLRHEYSLILVCIPLEEYLPITRSWFAAELSVSGQDGGCKQRGQTATIWLNALFMPRLGICNRDLHWQWINWTLLCDTMEVSMVRLASLAITQHVFQPALTGRPESGPELISRKIVSREREQRLYRGEQISPKNVSRELGPTSYSDFAKNIALMGAKKWGPTCDRDISNSAIYTTAIYRAYTVYRNVYRSNQYKNSY